MGCSQKSFKLVWRCHQLLSGFLVKSFPPSVTSVTLLFNDKGESEMIPGAVHSNKKVTIPISKFVVRPIDEIPAFVHVSQRILQQMDSYKVYLKS